MSRFGGSAWHGSVQPGAVELRHDILKYRRLEEDDTFGAGLPTLHIVVGGKTAGLGDRACDINAVHHDETLGWVKYIIPQYPSGQAPATFHARNPPPRCIVPVEAQIQSTARLPWEGSDQKV